MPVEFPSPNSGELDGQEEGVGERGRVFSQTARVPNPGNDGAEPICRPGSLYHDISQDKGCSDDGERSACPGEAVNGERDKSVAEDRDKAEVVVCMYASVGSNTRVRRRDRNVGIGQPCVCGGHRSGTFQPFSRQEMSNQLRKLKLKRALSGRRVRGTPESPAAHCSGSSLACSFVLTARELSHAYDVIDHRCYVSK